MLFLQGDATVKNSSGDTVIGKKSDSDYCEARLESLAVWQQRLWLSLLWQMAPIVSWIFLHSAETLTPTSGTEPAQKFTHEKVKQYQVSSLVAPSPNYTLVRRSGVRARSHLAASCCGAERNEGGSQPGGGSTGSPDKRSLRPDYCHWWASCSPLQHTTPPAPCNPPSCCSTQNIASSRTCALVFPSGYLNGESAVDRRVRARADRGTVTLKTQSWFETLKLGGGWVVTDRRTTWWVMLLLGALHWRMRPFIDCHASPLALSAQVALHLKIIDGKVSSIVFDLHDRNPCTYSLERKLCHSLLCILVNGHYLMWILIYLFLRIYYCMICKRTIFSNLSENIKGLYFAPHWAKLYSVLSVSTSATDRYIYEWNVKQSSG